MTRQLFGKTPDGSEVFLYTLSNGKIEAKITNYGGIVVSLSAPDASGNAADVVLGYDNLEGYLTNNSPYMGAIIGRYGNRIAQGRFSLNDKEYTLARNNGENSLHGGILGFDKVVWDAHETDKGLRLNYLSKDGEEGYPGNLSVTVTYAVTADNALSIDYRAGTDQDTVVNLTNHSYFNLDGQGEGDILGHEMMLQADRLTPVDAGLIPTGELRSVEGTPFDFRQATAIGKRIGSDDEQLQRGNGYDHNWVLNKAAGEVSLAARAKGPKSGRVLEVYTTEPGIQLYTGNFLDGSITGKSGKVYKQRYGFCLETQHFPDSPNQPGFPSTVLRRGEEYRSKTLFQFR